MDARRGADDDADTAEPDPPELETDVDDANAAPSVPTLRTRRYPADVSVDDRDLGWGELPGGSDRGDGWYLRERRPHHG